MKLAALISGISNFSAQYNSQSIAIALIVMSASVCTLESDLSCEKGSQASWVYGTATAVSFIGAVSGQLIMGYFGDILDRDKALFAIMILKSVSALLSGLVPMGSSAAVYAAIIVCRLFLGFGIGGV